MDDYRHCTLRGLQQAKGHLQKIFDFVRQPHSINSRTLDDIYDRCDKLLTKLETLEREINELEEMLIRTCDMVSSAKLELNMLAC
jgi:hypothetical protein